jgi:pimeloyl-ACP methyl ester carboxylesterase
MPYATLDGIKTHYEVTGDGPPLLMMAPAGFDSSISRWRVSGVWQELQPLDTLKQDFKLIAYDRREAGESSGRIEPLTWKVYAREAEALLDHLGIEDAFVIGGCMGCSVALAFAVHRPKRCRGLLLHWPVGGFRWMKKGRANFDRHIAFLREHGFPAVVERARKSKMFWNDPEAGPWSAAIGNDAAFAEAFLRQNVESYVQIVTQSRDNLFNDVMPSGATGEELLALTVPSFVMSGDDASHATSTAHALRELIPNCRFSPLMPPQQNALTVRQWIRESAASVSAPAQAAS